MKKVLLLGLVASGLLVTGCSKTSVVESPEIAQGTIAFRTNNDYAKVRGTEVTTATLNAEGQKFNVWGEVNIPSGSNRFLMENVEVSYDAATSSFRSASNYLWPKNDEEVKFWAVQNNYSGTTTVTQTQQKIEGFEPAVAHAGDVAMSDLQKDLIMAFGKGKKSTNETSGMALVFKHALSQIEFKAKNSSSSYDVYIAGISLNKVKGKGDVAFQTSADALPSWSNLSSEATALYHNISSVATTKVETTPTTVTQGKGAGSNFMLIPQEIKGYTETNTTGAYVRVYIRVVEKGTNTVLFPEDTTDEKTFGVADVALSDITWEAGKKYVYTLDFTNGYGNKPFEPTPNPKPQPNPGVDPTPVIPDVVTPTPKPTPQGGKPIFFTVTVSDWTEGGNNSINM